MDEKSCLRTKGPHHAKLWRIGLKEVMLRGPRSPNYYAH